LCGWADLLFGLELLRTLKSDDEGNVKGQFFGGFDYALCDVVAPHDPCLERSKLDLAASHSPPPEKKFYIRKKRLASKNVNKDTFNLWVPQQDFESLLDCFRSSAASDVEKVGGVASVEREHIHGCHGETCAIDEAADVTVEFDKVEVGFLRFDFGGFFLADVA
jgi:hypothetical protein